MRKFQLILAGIALFLGVLAGWAIIGPIGGAFGGVIGLLVAGATVWGLKAMGVFKPGFAFTAVHGEIDCPACKQRVEVVLDRDATTHHVKDIEPCEGNPAPHGVDCHPACIAGLNKGTVEFTEKV